MCKEGSWAMQAYPIAWAQEQGQTTHCQKQNKKKKYKIQKKKKKKVG